MPNNKLVTASNKLSKNGIIIPDRKRYGTERTSLDPAQDDAQEVYEAPFEAMKEGKATENLRQGYSVVAMPQHKGVDHSTASEGKDRVGKPWKRKS